MPVSKTVVISCAGMGKRLGIGVTKALVEVGGVPLIIRHLRQLDEVDDVRVVVGYQAERVIQTVRSYRNDVTFVFNHDYMRNGTGASVSLAARHANDLILTLDGDLLVHPDDMKSLLAREDEFVGVTTPGTDGPVLVKTRGSNAVGFSREEGEYEWTGVTQVRSERLCDGTGHVYQMIEGLLPLPCAYLRTKEIDTPDDYERAARWVANGFSDGGVVGAIAGRGGWGRLLAFADAFGESAAESCAPRLLAEMLPRSERGSWGESGGADAPSVVGACRSMARAGASVILLFDVPGELARGCLDPSIPGCDAPLILGAEEIDREVGEDGAMNALVDIVLDSAGGATCLRV